MTSQVSEISLSTTVRTLSETTGRQTCDVRSTVIRISQAQPISTTISSSVLHAEFKEIVYRLLHNKKGLV